jgi:uncharacterized protein YcnI
VPAVLRRTVTVAVLAVLSVLGLLLGSTSALAHVTVNSPGATQGGFAVLTFRVPSESPTATTTSVTIQVPAETPLASARVKPLAGWTAEITRQTLPEPVTINGREITEAIDTIVWTADDGVGLAPDEFQEFEVSTGPLPEVDEIVFKALQAYSDGTRVDWVEVAAPGSDTEPEHPAPALALAAASGDDSHDGHGAGGDSSASGSDSSDSSDDDSGALGVAIVGLVLAIAAAAAALVALGIALRKRTT